MPTTATPPLVTTEWLADHLDAPDLAVLDGSWHMPASGRDARAEYAGAHIPGAHFFDIDAISDRASPLPHMLPDVVTFSSRVRSMGIGDGTRVVVYDSAGLFSAARVWWMFRAMGHEDVAVLDGGLPKWSAEGRALTDEPTPQRFPRHFTPRFNAQLVRDLDDMKRIVSAGSEQIADARGLGRFTGTEPEPRAGLRGGHIPGARHVHYASLLGPDGTMKSPDDLRALFAAQGVDLGRPVVASCGTGVTAAIVALALASLGRADVPVYDGSWTEWGAPEAGTEVETGPARAI
jgi:thiosulfate/3-mercaptopyruvate sulfurtransferase